MNATEAWASIRNGRPYTHTESVYGSGREHTTVRFDGAAKQFVIETLFQDMNGDEHRSQSVVSEARAIEVLTSLLGAQP
jgi:hypothetical protein